jgi:hypothetical protein
MQTAKVHTMPKPIPRQARPVLWSDELRRLPARLLGQLPIESKFTIKVPGIKGEIVFVTHSIPEPRPRSLEPLFDGPELVAVALGVEADRLRPQDFLRLCLQKRDDPHFRVSAEHTLTGAVPDAAVTCSLGQVLDALGARLTGVALAEQDRRAAPAPSDGLEAAA